MRSLECRFECGSWANANTVVHIHPFKFQRNEPAPHTPFADLTQEVVLTAPWISPQKFSAYQSDNRFQMRAPADLVLGRIELFQALEAPLPRQLQYASLFQVDLFGDGSFLFPGSPRQIRGRVQNLVEQ